MAPDATSRPVEPTEPVQRRPSDALWFTILFASIAIGIGMTIFAPVGDDPPPATSATLPFASTPTTTEADAAATQPAPPTTTTAPTS